MPRFKRLTIYAVLFSLGAPTHAKEPEPPLKRSGKWHLNYGEGGCHLSATFGAGREEVVARFSQIGPDLPLSLTLFGKRLYSREDVFSRAQITFLPADKPGRPREVTHGSVAHPDGKLPALFFGRIRLDNRFAPEDHEPSLPAVTPAMEQAVHALEVRRKGTNFTLGLETMGPPMAAMRKCTDDLVRHWGVEPAELATRQSRAVPLGDPTTWARTNDYPAGMLFRGSSAFVSFRVTVDAEGAAKDCAVLDATQPPTIGPFTCDLIKQRARFTPARDKAGNPAADFYINSVFWKFSG